MSTQERNNQIQLALLTQYVTLEEAEAKATECRKEIAKLRAILAGLNMAPKDTEATA